MLVLVLVLVLVIITFAPGREFIHENEKMFKACNFNYDCINS